MGPILYSDARTRNDPCSTNRKETKQRFLFVDRVHEFSSCSSVTVMRFVSFAEILRVDQTGALLPVSMPR
jgi:hypothetical protein